MDHTSTFEKVLRGVLITLVLIFFLFPIAWIFLMSLQTNETILRIPPSLAFTPIIDNYTALITGQLRTAAGSLQLNFMQNMFNSVLLSVCSVALSLVLGVPAAYAFARFKFRLGEDIAFTLLSFRFAPALLVLLPLSLYFKSLGLTNTYIGLIWVYQLICLPLILWIVRGYFEDISPDIEHAYRLDGQTTYALEGSIFIAGAVAAAAGAACVSAGGGGDAGVAACSRLRRCPDPDAVRCVGRPRLPDGGGCVGELGEVPGPVPWPSRRRWGHGA